MRKFFRAFAVELAIVLIATKFAALAALYATVDTSVAPAEAFIKVFSVAVGVGNFVYLCLSKIVWEDWINKS